jgi:hypothetical protein
MSQHRTFGVFLVLLAIVPSVLAQPSSAQPFDQHRLIGELIEKMGSNRFQERLSAQKELETIGPGALELLRKAISSGNAEVSKRAAQLVRKIEERQSDDRQRGALAAIRKLEAAIANAQWRISTETGTLGNPKDIKSMMKEPYGMKGTVIMDYQTGKYRLDLQIITQWKRDHNSDFQDYSMEERYMFDGNKVTMMRRGKLGLVPPDENDRPGSRSDYNSGDRDPLKLLGVYGGAAGYDFFPPCFCGMPLSKFLEDRKPFKITENNRVWQIELADPDKLNGWDRILRINYDLSRGGLVTKAAWFLPKEQLFSEITIQPQRLPNNIWVPATLTKLQPRLVPPRASRQAFTEVKVNQNLDDGTFRLK